MLLYIRRYQIDVVYSRPDNTYLLLIASLAARIAGCRFVTYRQNIADRSKRSSGKTVYPLCSLAGGESPPVNFIPLTIDLARFPETEPIPSYTRHGNEPLRIIAVGKLIERKGHHLLIEAAAQLRDTLSLQIGIYGAYSEMHARQFGRQLSELILERGLQDCITLMPRISPDAMLAEHAKHHLFVYSGWVAPTRDPDEETYARATGACGTRLYSLIEAMAAGLPVVCASERHVVGAVENGGNGLVFEKGDAADLAAKIEAISQMDLAAMGARSRALIEAHHDAKDFPVRFENLLRSMQLKEKGYRQ